MAGIEVKKEPENKEIEVKSPIGQKQSTVPDTPKIAAVRALLRLANVELSPENVNKPILYKISEKELKEITELDTKTIYLDKSHKALVNTFLDKNISIDDKTKIKSESINELLKSLNQKGEYKAIEYLNVEIEKNGKTGNLQMLYLLNGTTGENIILTRDADSNQTTVTKNFGFLGLRGVEKKVLTSLLDVGDNANLTREIIEKSKLEFIPAQKEGQHDVVKLVNSSNVISLLFKKDSTFLVAVVVGENKSKKD